MSSYVPGTSRIIAKVELGRRDSWTTLGQGEGREISVVSAALKGTVRHHGVRYETLSYLRSIELNDLSQRPRDSIPSDVCAPVRYHVFPRYFLHPRCMCPADDLKTHISDS